MSLQDALEWQQALSLLRQARTRTEGRLYEEIEPRSQGVRHFGTSVEQFCRAPAGAPPMVFSALKTLRRSREAAWSWASWTWALPSEQRRMPGSDGGRSWGFVVSSSCLLLTDFLVERSIPTVGVYTAPLPKLPHLFEECGVLLTATQEVCTTAKKR